MTKVKICGLQEQEHVKTAVHAGADAIGFVLHRVNAVYPLSRPNN